MTLSRVPYKFILAMSIVVVFSNILVQFPVTHRIGAIELSDFLTWGAFTYPIAFLITDLTNRFYGVSRARVIVFTGFLLAVLCSATIPTILFNLGFFPFELSTERVVRISIASGTAFLVAQLLDIVVFDRLRYCVWWKTPLISSFLGSLVDTVLFFSLAFSEGFVSLGENDVFAIQVISLFNITGWEIPRWISWAIGDFIVKLLVGSLMLLPYGILTFRYKLIK